MDKTFATPPFSPKARAYIIVYEKIKTVRQKRGIFAPDYTKEVNNEIGKICKRFLSSIARVRQNEGLKALCEKDPEFAEAWNIACERRSYFNAVSKEAKLRNKIFARLEQHNENSSTQD